MVVFLFYSPFFVGRQPNKKGGIENIFFRKEVENEVIATITATTYFTNNIVIQRQVPLARAVTLLDHVNAIIPPDADLLEVHGASTVLLVPVQIIFSVDKAFIPHVPAPTKAGIYRRDCGRCAYCGRPIPVSEATMDHVVPQSLDGPSTWENLVNACRRCNEKKANRTPEQAGMPLRVQPFRPKVRLRPD